MKQTLPPPAMIKKVPQTCNGTAWGVGGISEAVLAQMDLPTHVQEASKDAGT